MEINKETLFLILLITEFLCAAFLYYTNLKLLREKAEQWVVLTVIDKEEVDKMMSKMGYVNSRKFIMDAIDNHLYFFEMISERKHRRLAIAELNKFGSAYEIERLIQPVGIDYTKIHQPLN